MPDEPPGRFPRVLEVLFSFRVGGSEVVGLELAREFARGGAEVLCTAIDGIDGPLRERCTRLGLEVVDLGLPIGSVLGRNGLSIMLARRLRQLRLDAIHLQHFLTLNKLGLPARLAGISRIVVTEHSDAQLRASLLGRARLRMNWRLAHHLTVIHPGIRQYLHEDLGIPLTRILVIPNGIETSHWQRSDRSERRAELGIGPELTFVFAGRIEAVKNVPDLIRAFLSAYPRLAEPATLIVVGDGTELAICQALVDGHPLGAKVRLEGEQPDVRRYLAAADIFVMNSLSEGVPRALLEAMCMGLPAICTAVGGIPSLLEGRGWLTRSGDVASLEAALIDACARPDVRAELGARAENYIRSQYDYRDIVRHYQDALGIASVTNPEHIANR